MGVDDDGEGWDHGWVIGMGKAERAVCLSVCIVGYVFCFFAF